MGNFKLNKFIVCKLSGDNRIYKNPKVPNSLFSQTEPHTHCFFGWAAPRKNNDLVLYLSESSSREERLFPVFTAIAGRCTLSFDDIGWGYFIAQTTYLRPKGNEI